jgi:tetratricopeptide (TPR) repeat protein
MPAPSPEPTLPPALAPTPPPTAQELKVYFIDVDQGDSILIDLGAIEILIDGGDKSPGVVAYLADYVDGALEVMVATHPHADHIGGLIDAKKIIDGDSILNYALFVELGDDHPKFATSLNNLGRLYKDQGKYDEALPFVKRALASRERTLGTNHPDVAISLNNLGLLYYDQGKYDEALPVYQRALAIYEGASGPNHPHVAIILNNLARLYYNQGKYDEALPLYQRALAIRERAFGPDHPSTKQCREKLKACQNAMRKR